MPPEPYQIDLPTLPSRVDRSNIKENGKLLSDSELAKAKQQFKPGKSKVRRGRGGLFGKQGPEFSVLRFEGDGDHYILYTGKAKKLGKGGFGTVKLAQRASDGKWFALKVLKGANKKELKKEQENLSQVNQEPKTLTRKAAGLKKVRNLIANEENEKDYILMELANGVSVYQLQEKGYPEARRVQIATNILESVNELHEQGLLHRDIKTDNFVVNPNNGAVSTVDLGFAEVHTNKVYYDIHKLGTPGHVAPELILESELQFRLKEIQWLAKIIPGLPLEEKKIAEARAQEDIGKVGNLVSELENRHGIKPNGDTPEKQVRYDEATEVYALGATLTEHFHLNHTIEENPQDHFADKILLGELPENASQPLQDIHRFVGRMLDSDPRKRPTLNEAIKFFKSQENQYLQTPGKVNNAFIAESKDLVLPNGRLNQEYLDNNVKGKNYDSIYIYDNNNRITENLHGNKIIDKLNQQGIFVEGIVHPTPDELEGTPPNFNDIRNQIEQGEQENISAVEYPLTAGNNVSDTVFEEVTDSLEGDKETLRSQVNGQQNGKNQKPAWVRGNINKEQELDSVNIVEVAEEELNDLHKEGKLHPDNLRGKLRALQNAVFKTGKQFLEEKFSSKKEAASLPGDEQAQTDQQSAQFKK